MAHKRKVRIEQRRSLVVGLARRILLRLDAGTIDPQDGLNQLRTMYLDESELLRDLKEMVQMGHAHPAQEVVAAAREWLAQHPVSD